MNTRPYYVQKHRDSDTRRERWAVIHAPTATWYFPTRYGHSAAAALCRRLNQGA